MPDEKTLPIPVEIPWQLAATTQERGPETLPPETTTISLFTYVPKLESLDKDYPDDRLIYLKFTVSISPNIPLVTPTLAFSRAMPIWYVVFDLRVTPIPETAADLIRPYFLAGSPIRRTMLETGVVGGQMFEGESESVAIGKSGSQMHESSRTSTDTSDWTVGGSINLGWIGLGASGSGTSTTVSGDRDVVQRVDTTNREASQERKELLSHTTNVNNVLTLLTAKHVGTPYLRFALWPQPLRPLTLDPSDPNLWYAELLNRRSSGIEGMQDFYAVVAIPKALKGFCIYGDLTRFSVLDALPKAPSTFELPFPTGPVEAAQIKSYLHNRYPKGTPLDQLDVDLANKDELARTVRNWAIAQRVEIKDLDSIPGSSTEFDFVTAPTGEYVIVALEYYYIDSTIAIGERKRISSKDFGWAWYTYTAGDQVKIGFTSYKLAAEVWLEMRREEYERELATSPLKNGTVSTLSTSLETCFNVTDKSIKVINISASATSPKSLNFKPNTPDPASPARPSRDLDKYRAAVLAWNALQNQLGAQLSAVRKWPTRDFRFDDPAVASIHLRSAAALREDDPANESLDTLLQWVKLPPKLVTALQTMKVTDLRGLAVAVEIAPDIERINRTRGEVREQPGNAPASMPRGCNPPSLESVPFALSAKDAATIRRFLGEALQARFEQVQRKTVAKPIKRKGTRPKY